MRYGIGLLVFSLLTGAGMAQNAVNTLTTTGCCIAADGWMWDVVAKEDIQICLLELCLADGEHDISIYTRFGTHVGNESNTPAWTSEGVAQRISPRRGGGLTKIPIDLDITLFQNERLGIYVTSSLPGGLLGNPCSPGGLTGTTGQLRTSNPDLDVFWGTIVPAPFNGALSVGDRVVSHSIHYVTRPTRRQCVQFQRNSDRASLEVGRAFSNIPLPQSDGFSPAQTRLPQNSVGDLIVTSNNFGGVFDIIMSPLPLDPVDDPDEVQNTPGGQMVNLDFTGPLFSIFGGPPGTFVQLPPPGPFGMPIPGIIPVVTPNFDVDVSAQMIVPDATNVDGFTLGQGVELSVRQDPGLDPAGNILNSGSTLALGDDDFMVLPLGFGFDFYGQNYTEVAVSSEGELRFDMSTWFGGQTIPRAAGSMIADGPPVIAPWASDWDPSASGTVRFSSNGQDQFSASWTGMRTFPGGPPATFGVTVDAVADTIVFDYDPSSVPSPGTTGISGGAAGDFPTAFDLSLAGPNDPYPLEPGQSPFESFLIPGILTDLGGLQITYDLDPNGFPNTVR